MPRKPSYPRGLPTAQTTGRLATGIEGHDLQVDRAAELQEVVVGAYVGMARVERDIDIDGGARINVSDAFVQGEQRQRGAQGQSRAWAGLTASQQISQALQ